MASQVFELLLAQDVPANFIQPMEGVVDAGAYRQLNVDFNLIKAGTAGTLELEHSATLREEGFFPLGAISASLTGATGHTPKTVESFLRYVRAKSDGAVAGNPVMSVTLVAKE
jgi:hypothetical protein